jgi:hypothetical protein
VPDKPLSTHLAGAYHEQRARDERDGLCVLNPIDPHWDRSAGIIEVAQRFHHAMP